MANRVKTISKYSGSAWGTEVPIGADATNVDMTTAPSDYDSSTSETSKVLIGTDDVKAIASDTDLTAWGKFNRFRRRVSNKFADYFATANLTGSSAGVTSTGDDSHAYTTAALNAYFSTVVGYSSAADVSSVGSVASQLSSLNSNMTSAQTNISSLQTNKINTSAIKNNLTTTDSGYVLDARQGKTLNDRITNLFYHKEFTITFTFSNQSVSTVTVNIAVSGYTALAIASVHGASTAASFIQSWNLDRADQKVTISGRRCNNEPYTGTWSGNKIIVAYFKNA